MAGWYPHAKFKEKECPRCGRSFTPRSGAARYCSSCLFTFDGKTQSVTQWGREMGIPPVTLRYRLKRGWSVEEALTKPVGNSGPKRKEVSGHGESS